MLKASALSAVSNEKEVVTKGDLNFAEQKMSFGEILKNFFKKLQGLFVNKREELDFSLEERSNNDESAVFKNPENSRENESACHKSDKNEAVNDPANYMSAIYESEDRAIPREPVFAVCEGERIVHTFQCVDNTPEEEILELLDEIDLAVIEEISRSKYLSSLQIYELISMRGFSIKRTYLRKKILKLMRYRLIQENEIVKDDVVRGIKFYELGRRGYLLAIKRGVRFHKGNGYLSYRKKVEINKFDTAHDVKRILAGNQIVIGMLMNGAQIQRFGIMETFRSERSERISEGCIMRTAANVKIDDNNILAYEVVRDIPDGYAKLADKVSRYYILLSERDYLKKNHRGEASFPQLVICGESLEHNRKIAVFLKEQGLWREEDPILFTEDLLNIKDSLQSLYEIKEEKIIWYRIPGRRNQYEDSELSA